ncbi:MAG: glycoside hydrolase family 2 TIM barrel-domain containing protein [Bacteroidia bacterium]
MIRITFVFLFALLVTINLHAQVSVAQLDSTWTMLVDGEPFEVKGATFGYGDDVANFDRYCEDLHDIGVNTIRTWATNEHTPKLLDAAHTHGIKVMLGIWMRHGRPGMEDDDSFNYLEDTTGMEAMYASAISTVEAYKEHPAVLTWGVGNEVYLNTATDAEKEAYSKFLERVCSQIKKLDSHHPITSVEAWTFGLEWWEKYVPSIDIYGLNSYGPGANYLAVEVAKKGIQKPYMVTEFGVTGEWDIKAKKNGVTVEPSDEQKYEAIADGYHNWIKNKPQCLGVYVFHYGNGDNFIGAWLLSHYDQKHRPQYWAIREAFTGKKPTNMVPEITQFELMATTEKSGTWVPVSLAVSDAEEEALAISFHYNQRTGSRKRRDQISPLPMRGNLADGFEIQLPPENGPVKIYVMASDSYPNIGIASTSIIVEDEEAAQNQYLVPRVSLPFYVYKDNQNLPYAPSGYMGNYESMKVDLNNTQEVHNGSTAIKISYNAKANWYGLALVDPANDWGDILGGYNISGAKTFSFWAKASDTQIKATIGFGLIGKDQKFPDTGKKSVEIALTKEWKRYTIKTKKLDLSCIRSGLVIFSSSNGFRHDIFIDDVVFE